MKKDTSWGNVARWYADHVESDDSYHKTVVLPNIIRMMGPLAGKRVLDLACGSGFFSEEFRKAGATVQGVDVSRELIATATKSFPAVTFVVAPAHRLSHIKNESVDMVVVILAIQNIREVKEMLAECKRILTPAGRMYIVMNHPAFRIPGSSSWQWDETLSRQYRRVDEYLSEKVIPIKMHPGKDPSKETISFHRPLQYYTKLIGNGGFAIARLEEWISNRVSEKGPRQKEEDRMRKEIPLFMALELVRHTDERGTIV